MNYIFISLLLMTIGFNDPAYLAELELCAENDPADWQTRLELVEIFLDQENYQNAFKYLSEADSIMVAPDIDSSNSYLNYLWALYYDQQDNIPKAIDKYLAAIELDSTNARAWRRLGYLHEVFSDGDQMVACFKHALAFTDDSAGVYYDMGVGYDYLDSLEAAVDSYRHTLAMSDLIPEAYLNLGVDLGYLGFPDSSLHYFEKAAAAGMEKPELYYNIGVMKFDSGQIEPALESFMKVLGMDPKYSPAQLQLGNIYEAIGDSGMAKVYYEQFVETASLLYLDDINTVKEKLAKYK